METYTFTEPEIEDLLNYHAYEIGEIINNAYTDIENELRDLGDNNE